MKLGVGLLAGSVVLLAISCGKDGSGEGTGSGGTGAVLASSAGSGGSSAAGGSGQASGAGGASAGSTAQSGVGGGGNASSSGSGGQAGTAVSGAGGTLEPTAGQGGSGEVGGENGAFDPTGSLTLFIMFDRSWSMNECGDGSETGISLDGGTQSLDCPTASRWDLTSSALVRFFQDSAAVNLNVALRFFPDDHPAVGCDGYPTAADLEDAGIVPPSLNCDIAACSEPLVPAAPLSAEPAPVDAQEAALVAAVMESAPPGPAMPTPNPATPTYPALAGAEKWATDYRHAHPDEPTAVVLITDGEPMGCDTNTNTIGRVAADANTTAGVLTYVIGLTGASEQALNVIASAGGTEHAFFVSDGSTAVADLFDALSTIRKRTP